MTGASIEIRPILEIAEMQLSNLDLAVLSACETGLGKGAAGEGMLGLQRAFAVAGTGVIDITPTITTCPTAMLSQPRG